MTYYLTRDAVLKWLETPSVYRMSTDELYSLDHESFGFLQKCASAAGSVCEDREFTDFCLREGLLTQDAVSIMRPSIIQSPNPSLRYLELQITDRCNLSCKHCYIGSGSRTELPVSLAEKVLSELEEMQGLRVLITGGEPLLHSGFREINQILPGFSFRKVLFSNGLLIRDETLRDLNVHEIQISLDGLEEGHDSLRGAGTYRTAVRAIRRSIDSGLDVSVSTMIHPNNLNDFAEMEEMLQEMGVKEWTVDVPCATGRLKDSPAFQISPALGGRYLSYGYGGGLHAGAEGFSCGLHLASVTAAGFISKCTFYSDRPLGRIEEGLRECWKRLKPVRLSEIQCDCEHIASCRGGCRYRAELLGNPLGKDLFRCALYDIMDSGKESICPTKGGDRNDY